MINEKGDTRKTSVSWVDIVDYGPKEKCHPEFMLRRLRGFVMRLVFWLPRSPNIDFLETLIDVGT